MNLNDLKTLGGVLTGQAVPREVTWTRIKDDGETEEVKFTVGVIKLGVAATERILTADSSQSKNAIWITETIRLGENMEERIPYEDACGLDSTLFLALSEAVASVNPRAKEAKEEGKDSPQTKSSGRKSS